MRLAALTLAALLSAATAPAINVVLDYTYDSGSFFSTGTANGQKARATVKAAADYFSSILDDSFARVQKPNDYVSTAPNSPNAISTWNWSIEFENPSTGGTVLIDNPVIPADEYRIYVGARNLPTSTLGFGGPGGGSRRSSISYYFPSQLAEIEAITEDFFAAVDRRGEPVGEFGRWGGSLTFDTVGTTWNYDHTVAPTSGQNDLLSVALHEIGHTLGFGASAEFQGLGVGNFFTGLEATAANGGSNPGITVDKGHWTNGTISTVFGGSASQEAAMDPSITTGTRKLWTALDAAALADIGWDVVTPGLLGDYNSDNLVNAADYTIWRDSLGTGNVIGTYAEWRDNYGASAPASSLAVPEPGSLVLLLLAGSGWRRRC
ncbi:hypothetical protein Pla108_00870 [Botrimarina colliarenosi]|uniref:Peptidase M10 metallopeptidase domain-containing protein n=1 Tax=Botrimarina colliarenosi TaxID=2528001 RepID=A0A5C6ALU9_9BACT|nr:PEP-CTERM sorting domain-containing protein [Botrimarina colliarenosi]TWT99153.1 hypothetical protein Pla108_00870 [Botrimarina colliarenosi]